MTGSVVQGLFKGLRQKPQPANVGLRFFGRATITNLSKHIYLSTLIIVLEDSTWMTMRPMSLYESGDSTGDVSLRELFGTPETIDGAAKIDLDRQAFLICRGGWPLAVDLRDEIALEQALDYYDAVVHSDINRADGIQAVGEDRR